MNKPPWNLFLRPDYTYTLVNYVLLAFIASTQRASALVRRNKVSTVVGSQRKLDVIAAAAPTDTFSRQKRIKIINDVPESFKVPEHWSTGQ